MPALGPRQEAICALVPRVDTGAEIGADHGITAAHLLARGVCGRMVVSDISAASLDKARRLFMFHALEARADFRVADGLDALEGMPAGAVVIAGLGGLTVRDILARGLHRLRGAALVLQPQSDIDALRAWLAQNGYRIDAERLAREGRRFYVALRAVPGMASYDERALLLGPCLLRERPGEWQAYLRWMNGVLSRVRDRDVSAQMKWIEEEMRPDELHSTGCIPRD